MRAIAGRNFGLAVRIGMAIVIVLACGLAVATTAPAQDDAKPSKDKDAPPQKDDKSAKQPPVKLGLHLNDARAFHGVTLLAPMSSTKTYLLDMEGKVLKTWDSDCSPALCPLLLENGHL